MAVAIFVVIALIAIIDRILLAYYLVNKYSKDPETPMMSEDDIKEFKEADAKATEDFNNVLANINSFMTGEESEHVEEQ